MLSSIFYRCFGTSRAIRSSHLGSIQLPRASGRKRDSKATPRLDGDPSLRLRKKKVAITFGYVGTRFHGLQMQPGQQNQGVWTIEDELELALFRAGGILESNKGSPDKIAWQRSSRTDKGVHAVQNVVSLKLLSRESDFDPYTGISHRLVDLVNSSLPDDIRVFSIARVGKSFNSRRTATWREYSYLVPITNKENSSNLEDNGINLDIDLFEAALAEFEGHHDFARLSDSSMLRRQYKSKVDSDSCMIQTNGKRLNFPVSVQGTRRIVYSAFVRRKVDIPDKKSGKQQRYLDVSFVGSSFLPRQIRMMVGASMAVALGKLPIEVIKGSLELPTNFTLTSYEEGQAMEVPFFLPTELLAPAEPLSVVSCGFKPASRVAVHTFFLNIFPKYTYSPDTADVTAGTFRAVDNSTGYDNAEDKTLWCDDYREVGYDFQLMDAKAEKLMNTFREETLLSHLHKLCTANTSNEGIDSRLNEQGIEQDIGCFEKWVENLPSNENKVNVSSDDNDCVIKDIFQQIGRGGVWGRVSADECIKKIRDALDIENSIRQEHAKKSSIQIEDKDEITFKEKLLPSGLHWRVIRRFRLRPGYFMDNVMRGLNKARNDGRLHVPPPSSKIIWGAHYAPFIEYLERVGISKVATEGAFLLGKQIEECALESERKRRMKHQKIQKDKE